MKTLKFVLTLVCLSILAATVALGADAVVVAPVVTPSGFQSVINWMMQNQVVVGMLLVGIYDFICAINPAWANNGLVHAAYLFAMRLAGKPTNTTPVA